MLDQPTFKSFFMISCYIWYYNNLNLKFEISVPRILQMQFARSIFVLSIVLQFIKPSCNSVEREKKHISSSQWAKSSDLIWVKDNIFLTSSLLTQYWFLTISFGLVFLIKSWHLTKPAELTHIAYWILAPLQLWNII